MQICESSTTIKQLMIFTKKIKKEDGLIELDGDAYQNLLKIRAFNEWPGTYFFAKKNDKQIRVKITDADLDGDKLKINKVIFVHIKFTFLIVASFVKYYFNFCNRGGNV